MIKRYDAGLLSDYGGGNVEWWQDYLRAEIERCNDHWEADYAALEAERDRLAADKESFFRAAEEARKERKEALDEADRLKEALKETGDACGMSWEAPCEWCRYFLSDVCNKQSLIARRALKEE